MALAVELVCMLSCFVYMYTAGGGDRLCLHSIFVMREEGECYIHKLCIFARVLFFRFLRMMFFDDVHI